MSINFGNLPQEVMNGFCSYLDKGALLNMRQVSKATKIRVDFSMLSARATVIKHLSFNGENGEIIFSLEPHKLWNFCLWKSCVASISNMLDIPKFKATNRPFGMKLMANMGLKQARMFLTFLKPFIRSTEFTKISFIDCTREIISKYADFLSGKSIPKLMIMRRFTGRFDFSRFVEFIESFNPEHLDVSIRNFGKSTKGFVKGSVSFALKLADMVQSLTIFIDDEKNAYLNSVSFLRDLHSRKCEKLEIRLYTRTQISLTDVENILQCLHRSNKKVVLRTWTTAEPMNVVFGEYRVKTWEGEKGEIEIKHLEMI